MSPTNLLVSKKNLHSTKLRINKKKQFVIWNFKKIKYHELLFLSSKRNHDISFSHFLKQESRLVFTNNFSFLVSLKSKQHYLYFHWLGLELDALLILAWTVMVVQLVRSNFAVKVWLGPMMVKFSMGISRQTLDGLLVDTLDLKQFMKGKSI